MKIARLFTGLQTSGRCDCTLRERLGIARWTLSIAFVGLGLLQAADLGEQLHLNRQGLLTFDGDTNRVYLLESSSDLAVWNRLGSLLKPAGETFTTDVGLGEPCGFFKGSVFFDHGVGFVIQEDPDFLFLAAFESGSHFGVRRGTSTINGVSEVGPCVFWNDQGDWMAFYVGTNGLPERMVTDGLIFLYANYRSNAVDLAVVSADATNRYYPGVPLDSGLLPGLLGAGKPANSGGTSAWGLRGGKGLSFGQLVKSVGAFVVWSAVTVDLSMSHMGATLAGDYEKADAALRGMLELDRVIGNYLDKVLRDEPPPDPAPSPIRRYGPDPEQPVADYSERVAQRGSEVAQAAEHTQSGQAAALRETITVLESFNQIAQQQNMVWIPPGTFTMGSPATEAGRGSDEGPQTQVTLTRGFFMGRYEVTQGEYEAVQGSNPSRWKGTNLPVDQATWNDAVAYCQALTQRERSAGRLPAGWEYRLPTEAQWEYACRAGTTTRFSFGDIDAGLEQYGWYTVNSGSRTHPVGGKQPNPWGLYDMHGNVWEWCLDWSESYPGGSVSDPTGPSTGSSRVFRGGGWRHVASNCRSAERNYTIPSYYDPHGNLGFRVALVQVP